jgi:hypothetical protein
LRTIGLIEGLNRLVPLRAERVTCGASDGRIWHAAGISVSCMKMYVRSFEPVSVTKLLMTTRAYVAHFLPALCSMYRKRNVHVYRTGCSDKLRASINCIDCVVMYNCTLHVPLHCMLIIDCRCFTCADYKTVAAAAAVVHR